MSSGRVSVVSLDPLSQEIVSEARSLGLSVCVVELSFGRKCDLVSNRFKFIDKIKKKG